MNKYKNKILTIPNLLSIFRLCLIPLILWLYMVKQDYQTTLYVLLVSGLSDVVDGIIARKCNMVSDFGKIIDPIADKLTQIAMLFCLVSRFNYMIIPLVFLIIKEIFSGITHLLSFRRAKQVKGAVWHGKLTTVTLYVVIAVHLIWYNIPVVGSHILVGIAIGVMLMSAIMYSWQNIKAIKNRSFDK